MEEQPEYWMVRVKPSPATSHRTATERLNGGANALSWTAALRVCRARGDLPPEDMIDPGWLDEWLAKRPGARAPITFVEYVIGKVRDIDAYDIDVGLRARARPEDVTELFDEPGADQRIFYPLDGRPVAICASDIIGSRSKKDDDYG